MFVSLKKKSWGIRRPNPLSPQITLLNQINEYDYLKSILDWSHLISLIIPKKNMKLISLLGLSYSSRTLSCDR